MSRQSRRYSQQQQPPAPTPYYSVPQQSPSRAHSYSTHQSHIYQPQPQPVVYVQTSQPIPQHQPQPVVYVESSQPYQYSGGPRPAGRSTSATPSNRHRSSSRNSRQHTQYGNTVVAGVATGNIGAGYGPYAHHPEPAREAPMMYTTSRHSVSRSERSGNTTPVREKRRSRQPQPAPPQRIAPTTTTVPQYMWDKDPDLDDALHHPDPPGYTTFTVFSWRGWVNAAAIFIIVLGLLGLFIGFPIVVELSRPPSALNGFNIGGINGSGQIPDLPGLRRLIDPDTPDSALTRVGDDGFTYDLAFSDEFNLDGRTFYPGDDPFWEAADLYYWPTTDVEWYDPSAVTTKDGKMVITMTQQFVHDLNFQSGMVTSWNKLCFNTGYVEVSVSLPGSNTSPGLWPGAWTLGNLGRAGYGGTTQGMWPYTYDTCDSGTFPNQITKDNQPASSVTGGQGNSLLSLQPGQKLSACSCPGSDHPGPSHDVGRGAPEIDIIEAEIDVSLMRGQVSQSFQCAPYDAGFGWNSNSPATTVVNSNITKINQYRGGPYQQAMSALTYIDDSVYGGQNFATFGVEYWSDPNHREDGYITWFSEGKKTWTATAASIGPNAESKVGQRLISEEPMYVILNLGQSPDFQKPDYKHLTFPAMMYIDYVRIYQRRGIKNGITCDPPNRPTTDYINRHMNVYTNANISTWEMANLTFPRNSLYDGC